jgi:hypothetical protein
MIVFVSQGKAFCQTKVQLRVAFFTWSAALRKILTMIISESGKSLWLIGVVYVKGIESLWTIFCCIVRLPTPFRMFSLVDLGRLGSCLDELSICMLVGKLLVTFGVLLCGQ